MIQECKNLVGVTVDYKDKCQLLSLSASSYVFDGVLNTPM